MQYSLSERMRGERGERNRGWESVRHRERFQAGPQQISTRMRDGQHNHRNQTNWRDQRGITSYYFTRFADDINEKVLWQHFKRWGDVREVYISKQTNENGRRYGFVRYKDVKDEYRLERQLDSIVVGGLKLYVNLPRFGRRNGGNNKMLQCGRIYYNTKQLDVSNSCKKWFIMNHMI